MEKTSKKARRGPKPNPDVRENLIREGVKLFHERGYTATGVKDIVDAAAVPKGSFYNYFSNKEAFGQEVIDAYFERRLVSLRELLGNQNVPPLERLKNYFETRIRGYQAAGFNRGCMLGNFSLEMGDQSVSMRERLSEHFRTWHGLLESCIAQAQETGAIRNQLAPALLAQFLLNSWEGALLRMRAEKSDAPLKEFTQVVFGALLM